MRYLFLFLALSNSYFISSQKAFTFICNQNVFIPGQQIWFGLAFDPLLKNKLSNNNPTVYLSITGLKLNTIQRHAILSKDSYFTSHYTIPADLASGSYVLAATIYNQSLHQIIEEQSYVIHIIGKESGNYSYFAVGHDQIKLQSIPSEQIPSGNQSVKIRNKLCLKELTETLASAEYYSITDTKYLLQSKKSIYINPVLTDYLYSHTQRFKLKTNYQMPGIYDSDLKQMYQMKNADKSGEYLLTLSEDHESKNVQYLDFITNTTIDQVADAYPDPIWKNIELNSTILNEQVLKSNLEKTEIISRLFNQYEPLKNIKKYPKQSLPQADNYLETKNYQAFQSTELFLEEVYEPIGIKKMKNGEYNVRLMRTDKKEFYESSPLLLINGVVMNSIQALIDLPYQEIESFAFYRKVNETRKSFGPQARYGAIEVSTKPSYIVKKSTLPLSGVLSPIIYPRNLKEYDSGDSHPWFYPIQYIGKSDNKPFCYFHNDEKGIFLIQGYAGLKLAREEWIQAD